jgi:hypothetical protein
MRHQKRYQGWTWKHAIFHVGNLFKINYFNLKFRLSGNIYIYMPFYVCVMICLFLILHFFISLTYFLLHTSKYTKFWSVKGYMKNELWLMNYLSIYSSITNTLIMYHLSTYILIHPTFHLTFYPPVHPHVSPSFRLFDCLYTHFLLSVSI